MPQARGVQQDKITTHPVDMGGYLIDSTVAATNLKEGDKILQVPEGLVVTLNRFAVSKPFETHVLHGQPSVTAVHGGGVVLVVPNVCAPPHTLGSTQLALQTETCQQLAMP